MFVGTAQRSDHLEDLGAGGRKISKIGFHIRTVQHLDIIKVLFIHLLH
jgi:hypothetical protein